MRHVGLEHYTTHKGLIKNFITNYCRVDISTFHDRRLRDSSSVTACENMKDYVALDNVASSKCDNIF